MSEGPEMRAALRVLRARYGLEIVEHRRPALAAVLETIGGASGIEAGLERLLRRDPDACERVLEAMTVPETYFFRHPAHFTLLEEIASRRAAEGAGIRALSAGCASGEEAWSIAATLAATREEARERDRVVGWDLSEKRVQAARTGRYRAWSVRAGVAGHERWIRQQADTWEVAGSLRPMVRFETVNLVEAWPAEPLFDAIFFRNVAIYWDHETASAVLGRLASLLAPGGCLFVGPSDPGAPDPRRWEHSIEAGARLFRARQREPMPRAIASRPIAPARRAPRAPTAARVQLPASRVPACEPRARASVEPSPAVLSKVALLADAGRCGDALELLRAQPHADPTEAGLWEAILLLELGDVSAAIDGLRRCVFLEPENRALREWLATAYRAAGRIEDAVRERRNAAELEAR